MRALLALMLTLPALVGCGPRGDSCKALRADFLTALSAADTSCTADADCDCAPGGLGDAGCGRVMSALSARDLHTRYGSFQEAGCTLDFQCAPQLCQPACVAGRCVESPPAGLP